ncbi:response regulator [Pedobacter sp. BS3]|uniref:hybrid sensor histidine kinase/response regulator n=1 Tax=Pedobacter sp. BS3 TaxID=2567937 RepID=UPI0011ECD6E9|nr:hybrid sensor histidine kinase/response regulator [Pedobacter sp. BS3]TZF82583.1 response regulator [Pedobacter sp. BS3]
MSEKIKVLYIDDEPNNLISFKASFRLDYQIYTADNTQDALKHLESHPDMRIIFCDQRMPDKTGVEFFEDVRAKYPLPIRILLTGYTDIESVIDAINKSHIYRYVKKPWINEDIVSAIDEGNKFYLANSMLSVKNDILQKAYNELDKFAYSVSHDIRGPLSGIAGAITLASEMNDIGEIKDMLRLMGKSVKKLDEFIMSMHDYYSLKRGELHIADINFDNLITDLKEIYKIYTTTRNIHFETSVHQTEPFRSDELSLKIILNNLLSNAFKYQKRDNSYHMVKLSIDVQNGMATFVVEDNGVGIPEKHIGEIFNLFFRASALDAGTGFGLYNVKDALLKLNGQVHVDSTLGIGSTFTIKIPNK